MKTFALTMIPLAIALTGCGSKTYDEVATTTSLATGAVQVNKIMGNALFKDERTIAPYKILVATAAEVQEVGGGTCLILVPGGANPTGMYGIVSSCSLGVKKGSLVYYRFGRSVRGGLYESYAVAISEAEANALVKNGWHMASYKAMGSALNGTKRPRPGPPGGTGEDYPRQKER